MLSLSSGDKKGGGIYLFLPEKRGKVRVKMGAGGSFGQRNEEKTRVNKGRNIFSASEIFGGRE